MIEDDPPPPEDREHLRQPFRSGRSLIAGGALLLLFFLFSALSLGVQSVRGRLDVVLVQDGPGVFLVPGFFLVAGLLMTGVGVWLRRL